MSLKRLLVFGGVAVVLCGALTTVGRVNGPLVNVLIDAFGEDICGAVQTIYRDEDGDGYGDPNTPFESIGDCDMPEGYTDNPDDCDDQSARTHPGARDVFDGKDNDCDGKIDSPLFLP